jgi:hypothetical protein
MNFLFFLAPFFWGTQSERPLLPRRAGALREGPVPFGRNRQSRSREVRSVHPGHGTAGAGIGPKQCPGKAVAEKGWPTELGRLVRYGQSYVRR